MRYRQQEDDIFWRARAAPKPKKCVSDRTLSEAAQKINDLEQAVKDLTKALREKK